MLNLEGFLVLSIRLRDLKNFARNAGAVDKMRATLCRDGRKNDARPFFGLSEAMRKVGGPEVPVPPSGRKTRIEVRIYKKTQV